MAHPLSRRGFLAGLATGSAVLGTTAGLGTPVEPVESEEGWRSVRELFPFSEDRVPMNAANLCPSPTRVSRLVSELTLEIDKDCSFQNRARFSKTLEDSRSKVALHLGVSPDEIALVRNTSEGNNIVNNGLPLGPEDEVVLWDQNHPTNNIAWDVRASRFGSRVRRVSTPPGPEDPGQLIEVFEKALSDRTRVLALTHVSNITGIRLPVREICQIAHRRGVFVHVDGAQTWGCLDVNLPELLCDSYSASSHKWFCGPKEAGILFVKKERIPGIWPGSVAPGWGDDVEPDPVGARKFESLGQRDDACLAAVGATAEIHFTLNPAAIERRVLELAERLKTGLKDAGWTLVTPESRDLSAGVCIVEASAERRAELFEKLYLEHGIAGAPTGGLRLCPHVYNTPEHVDRAVEALRKMRA